MQKQTWASAERNKEPILGVLRRVLPAQGQVLEIGSGTGQHARYFAENLPALVWQPSDIDAENLASIRAYVEEAALANLRAPLTLDVRDASWGVADMDAVYSANMVHIAPWECTEALIRGAARTLRSSGVLVLYGPYRLSGAHTAPSNEQFDEDLQKRDPRWGVRDAEAISALAEQAGLRFTERVAMPANNQCLVFCAGRPDC